MKIVIVTNIPSPYRIPLFNQIHENFKSRNWKLHVIFLTKSYKRRKWKVDETDFHFDFEYLKDWHISLGEGFSSLALSLLKSFRSIQPDLIIVAGFSMASLWTLIYAKMFHIPFLIWSGETIAEDRMRSRFRSLRNILRYTLIQSAAAFVAYGTEAKKYLLKWKTKPENIFIGINTVDTEFISKRVKELRLQKQAFLTANRLPLLNILFIGYLEKRKGVHFILEAVEKIQKEDLSLCFGTHIVGSGPEEGNLRNIVEANKLRDVNFWGFKQKEEIPEFLAFSDLLIFSSIQELYGLVPIEAMAAGVPVLCSVHAGCTIDLVKHNVNGLVIDPVNTDKLKENIIFCLRKPEFLSTLARNAENTISSSFKLSDSVRGFAEAIEYVFIRHNHK
ncbi:glycosyltransferase family 4 protein [bacterium]|nr:glycosyltransferase family 4 protein [bacterium]